MVLKKLKEYLDTRNVRYTLVSHSPAYTAQEIATLAHIPGRELAKTVIVRADGKMIMVVVPAPEMVDLKSLKKVLGASHIELAMEDEFRNLFGECEPGAMPPFGNLYDMDVVVASGLAEDREIAFNAGTHRELVKMAYEDFERLVHPRLAAVGVPRRSRDEGGWDDGG